VISRRSSLPPKIICINNALCLIPERILNGRYKATAASAPWYMAREAIDACIPSPRSDAAGCAESRFG
jgi:hypothetical protein